MANIQDKRIQTLTKTSASTPQLQTNTGSLGGDIISAAQFGLSLFQQNKAQEELKLRAEQQSQKQTQVATAVTELDDLVKNLEVQNINPVKSKVRIEKFLNRFDPETRLSVQSQYKGLTGKSTSAFISDVEKQELARMDKIQGLQQQAAELSPYSKTPPPDINSASPDELRDFIVGAKSEQARIQSESAKLDMRLKKQRAASGDREATAASNNATLKVAGFEFNQVAKNAIVQNLQNEVKNVDMSDPTQVQEVLQRIREAKANAPTVFSASVEQNHGFVPSTSQASEAIQPILNAYNNLEKAVLGGDLKDITSDMLATKANLVTIQAIDKYPEKMLPLVLAKNTGVALSAEFTVDAADALNQAMFRSGEQNTQTTLDNFSSQLTNQGYDPKDVQNAVKYLKGSILNASKVKDTTPDQKDFLTESLVIDLNPPTQAQLQKNLNSGLALDRLSELADPETFTTYGEKSDEVLAGIKRTADVYLGQIGTKFKTSTGRLPAAVARGVELTTSTQYQYNPESGNIELVRGGAETSDGRRLVNKINKFINDTKKSLGNYGDDNDVKEFEEELNNIFVSPNPSN